MSEKEEGDTAEGRDSPQWYKERAEKNRQRALLLKKAKLVAHPYAKEADGSGTQGRQLKVQGKKVVDSGGGFLIEDDDEVEQEMLKWVEDPDPILIDLPTCEECNKKFQLSYLLTTFNYNVCDSCRDRDDKHSLITKTEAKETYLLRDHDLDLREPPLKFILKANPHRAAYGHMKLYLHLQIEKRALEVWGSEEALVEEKEKRDVKRQETKIKRFNKKVKQLRMEVRSSVYDRTKKASHSHEFGEDTYNEDDDTYTHTCTECEYEETYEKM